MTSPFDNDLTKRKYIPSEKSHEGLRRDIGVAGLAANVVNLTIGGGLFILPALVYQKLGTSSMFAYLVCGVLILMVMMCFAQIGKRTESSGGIYNYVTTAFGPYAGFVTSNLYWLGFGLISDAAIANALLEIVSQSLPWLNSVTSKMIFLLALFGVLTIINVRGAKHGAWLVKILTLAKILPLLLIAGFSLSRIDATHLTVSTAFDFSKLGEACIILFFAFAGGEAALTPGGEIRNPSRTVPLGFIIGMVISVVIYVVMHFIAQGMLGDQLAYTDAPLTDIATLLFGKIGITMIVVASVVSIMGAISGDLLTMPRFLFAASKDQYLPSILSTIHPVNRTPHIAIIIYAFLAFVLSLSSSFTQLATVSTAIILITYLMVMLSFIRQLMHDLFQKRITRFKHVVVIIFVAVVVTVILWFLSHVKKGEVIALIILFVMATLTFYRKRIITFLKQF